MVQQIIQVDGSGEPLNSGNKKSNENFTEVYSLIKTYPDLATLAADSEITVAMVGQSRNIIDAGEITLVNANPDGIYTATVNGLFVKPSSQTINTENVESSKTQVLLSQGQNIYIESTGNFYKTVPLGTSTLVDDYNYIDATGYQLELVETSERAKQQTNDIYYLDQFFNGFFGRGKISAESTGTATERAITVDKSAGVGSFDVADSTVFPPGCTVTIEHSEGVYHNYFVRSQTGGLVVILPSLQADVTTASRVELTWYDEAHAGKFYQRFLGNKLAILNEKDSEKGRRVFFTQFDDGNLFQDEMISVGGATVNYFDALNIGQGVVGEPVEFSIEKTAYSDLTSGQGMRTKFFPVNKNDFLRFQFIGMARSTSEITAEVIDQDSNVIKSIPFANAEDHLVHKIYSIFTTMKESVTSVALQFRETAGSTNTIIIDQIEVSVIEGSDNSAIPPGSNVVVIGDSWVAGDLITTPERESFIDQLALSRPDCNFINKGVGGNKIGDIKARLESDVVAYNPHVVIISTGTNDSSSPSSGVFFPNAVDNFKNDYRQVINRCKEIGARVIVIGAPALGENLGGLINYQANDRAKTYVKYFQKDMIRNNRRPLQLNKATAALKPSTTDAGYITGALYKDFLITMNQDLDIDVFSIKARAFDGATSATLTCEIYDATRTTVLATATNTPIIAAGAVQDWVDFDFSSYSLTSGVDYIIAIGSPDFWSVDDSGFSLPNSFGSFDVNDMNAANTTPPAAAQGLIPTVYMANNAAFNIEIPDLYEIVPAVPVAGDVVEVLDKDGVVAIFKANVGDSVTLGA